MPQNGELSPLRQLAYLPQIVRHPPAGLRLIGRIKKVEIHAVVPLRKHMDGADDKIQRRRLGQQTFRVLQGPGRVSQLNTQPEYNPISRRLPRRLELR